MVLLLGANHRSAPVEIREKLALSTHEVQAKLSLLFAEESIDAAYWLSTCNRVDILIETPEPEKASDFILNILGEISGLPRDVLENSIYIKRDSSAAEHLFRVVSGLDSMILGEPQIAGQVREAYTLAQRAGSLSTQLDRLLQRAMKTSKTIRTETAISRHPISVASTAVELARSIFGDLSDHRALLLGAGKMSALMGEHLCARGIKSLKITSRKFVNAEKLAKKLSGEPLHWDGALQRIHEVDVLISGTAAMQRVLNVQDIQKALKQRRGRPLLIVDIGVPRDIDPEVNELDNVYLYDIDALQMVVDHGLDERRQASVEALKIVSKSVKAWERWLKHAELSPTLATLSDQWHRLGRLELERHRRKFGSLDSKQEQALREYTRALIQKLLHQPMKTLKTENLQQNLEADTIKQLFGLDQKEEPSSEKSPGPSHLIDGGKSGE